MNEQQKKEFLKRMGYSNGLIQDGLTTKRRVKESPKYENRAFNGKPKDRKKKDPPQIESMNEARKLYNLFKAGDFREMKDDN